VIQIDERARRRPGWTEGLPAELADGQAWTFPRTRLRLRASPAGDGRHGPSIGRTAGGEDLPRMGEWIAAITGAPGTVPADRYWTARFDAAASLLRINYDLADEEIGALLVWDEDDPASVARWDAIDAAILGVGGPKPTPAT
jgi:hypothetical protein